MKKKKSNILEKINEFRYSDSLPATATKFLLAILAAGPFLVVGSAAAGIFSATKSFEKSKRYSKKQIENSIRNLKHRKLIEIIQEKDGQIKVQLSNRGKKRTREFSISTLSIPKPKKWDGKWRILMFDIPSKPKIYDKAREALRKKIKELRFYQMQKSAWAYPYECEDEILLIAELYNIQKFIEIITVEKILHEQHLKKFFKI